MPTSGTQCWLCDLPIRYDTYVGCSHDCRYCFARRKQKSLTAVRAGESVKGLLNFINGKRRCEVNWCDWGIPLHIGGMSDPFQPCEKEQRRTLDSLKALRDARYPFVVSTKGRLVAEPEYLEILGECNAVIQISAACAEYDRLEPGAPPFAERMQMAEKVAPHCKRLIIRVQPYLREYKARIIEALHEYKMAGVYGIVIEGMKFPSNFKNARGVRGLVQCGGDFVYRKEALALDYAEIKREAHRLGLAFYCGENRLRAMGDNLTCCGVDGLAGFKPNYYNVMHFIHDETPPKPTAKMREVGTAMCFHSMIQTGVDSRRLGQSSFAAEMVGLLKKETVKDQCGLSKKRNVEAKL